MHAQCSVLDKKKFRLGVVIYDAFAVCGRKNLTVNYVKSS